MIQKERRTNCYQSSFLRGSGIPVYKDYDTIIPRHSVEAIISFFLRTMKFSRFLRTRKRMRFSSIFSVMSCRVAPRVAPLITASEWTQYTKMRCKITKFL